MSEDTSRYDPNAPLTLGMDFGQGAVTAPLPGPVIRFRVYGFPIAQGRPRAFIPKGWTRPVVHDPEDSRDWKRTVMVQAIEHKPEKPLSGALHVSLGYVLQRPKSVSVKKRPHHVVRPDVENMSKAICDAIRGVIYMDDSQIVELLLRKGYGEQPGVEIEIMEVL